MSLSLTPELEDFVHSRVISGRYTSASEVVREALRLLENQDRERGTRLEAFRSELDHRLNSLDDGKGVDGELVFAQILKKSAARRRT